MLQGVQAVLVVVLVVVLEVRAVPEVLEVVIVPQLALERVFERAYSRFKFLQIGGCLPIHRPADIHYLGDTRKL